MATSALRKCSRNSEAHRRDHDAFLDELFFQRGYGAVNQCGAVIDDGGFHVRRQRLHRLGQLLFHVQDDLARIRAVTHDDDAADGFAVAVQIGDAAAFVGAELDVRHVTQQNRHAVLADTHGDFFQVIQIR